MDTVSVERTGVGLRLRTPGVVAAWGVAALLLTGCGGKKTADASPTTSSTAAVPTSETTSTTVGVDQVPAVITVEYAQRVMDALDKAEGDATRMLYAAKVPTKEWHDRLVALFDGSAFDNAEADFGRDAAQGFADYRNPPGDPVTQVRRIHDSTNTCIALDVRRDFGPQLTQQPAEETLNGIVFLRPKKAERDPQKLNPTAWAITADGDPRPGVDLTRICHSSG